MQTKMLVMLVITLSVSLIQVNAQVAGQFVPPISVYQTGDYCSTPGSQIAQGHLDWYEDLFAYHYGEDWNGMCSGNTDANYPLLAMADGVVTGVQTSHIDSTQGKKLFIKYSFPYALEDDGQKDVSIVYLHINDTVRGLALGEVVEKGDHVAYLGDTGSGYKNITFSSHLHMQALWKHKYGSTYLRQVYRKNLQPEIMVDECSPSLIVDDRLDAVEHGRHRGWNVFYSYSFAPGSTAYLEFRGEKKTIQQAVVAGWIDRNGLIFHNGTSWYRFKKYEDTVFYTLTYYGFKVFVDGVKIKILLPGNNYQYERFVQDAAIHLNEYENIYHMWLPVDGTKSSYEIRDWLVHKVSFTKEKNKDFPGAWDGELRHYTNLSNPLLRYSIIYDRDDGGWKEWRRFDPNHLY